MDIKFVDALRKCENLYTLKGVSDEEIENAQKTLGIKFASEYYEYLKTFGVASVTGHEFTGLGAAKRLSVVENTLQERELAPGKLDKYYVVEQCNIDGIIVLQAEDGKVYYTKPFSDICLAGSSLAEYLKD